MEGLRWEYNYSTLEKFIENNDRLPNIRERPLYNWILTQRTSYQRGSLSREKIKKLETLQYWLWNCRDAKWEYRYQELLKHIRLTGHFPTKFGNGVLYKWTKYQKKLEDSGLLDKWKTELLQNIVEWPYWDYTKKYDPWTENYISLKLQTGRIEIVSNGSSDLANWINVQKKMYRKNLLPVEKIRLLETLKDWSWNIPAISDKWKSTFEDFRTYLETKGQFPKCRGTNRERTLYYWMRDQKQKYRIDVLDQEKIDLLESIEKWIE
jgi:hypothetical protein